MKNKLCGKELYIKFLEATNQRYTANALSEVSPNKLSHDAISTWLRNTKISPKEIWQENKQNVVNKKGVIILDDTVAAKQYSEKIECVRAQYSGTEHRVIRGIGVVNMVFLDESNNPYPMNLRIWNPEEDKKTKNDHFRDMMKSAKNRGIIDKVVVADSWYSSLKNIKYLRDLGYNWVMGLAKNRLVNLREKIEDIDIPQEGRIVHLRGYGTIKLFRLVEKNGYTRHIGTSLLEINQQDILQYMKQRWSIEVIHRELKQTCGIGKCQAHTSRSQRNHIVLSVISWIRQRSRKLLEKCSVYELNWKIIKESIKKLLKQLLQRVAY